MLAKAAVSCEGLTMEGDPFNVDNVVVSRTKFLAAAGLKEGFGSLLAIDQKPPSASDTPACFTKVCKLRKQNTWTRWKSVLCIVTRKSLGPAHTQREITQGCEYQMVGNHGGPSLKVAYQIILSKSRYKSLSNTQMRQQPTFLEERKKRDGGFQSWRVLTPMTTGYSHQTLKQTYSWSPC